MNNNSKCFIKDKNGTYKEITFKKFKELRNEFNNFKNRKFIKVQGMLFEVSKSQYRDYYRELDRRRYREKIAKNYVTISIANIQDNEKMYSFTNSEPITNVEINADRKIELQKLNEALQKLTGEEYEIVKKIFFEEISIRKYAKSIGISNSTLQYKIYKIIKKLKKYINN